MERTLRVSVIGRLFDNGRRHMISAAGAASSICGTNGVAERCSRRITRAGRHGDIDKSLALELGPHGITVNSVAPGLIETEIGMDFPLKPQFWDYAKEHIPLGRLGKARDVGTAVVFLASDAGAYITGQHIIVDGGLLAEQFPRLQFYTGPK